MKLEHQVQSEIIDSVVTNFAQATGLAVVLTDIDGNEISERYNFSSFCEQIRCHPTHSSLCHACDRSAGFEASKQNKPYIYKCHAGLVDVSIPLKISGHLVGFILCGQVKLQDDTSAIDPQLLKSFSQDPALIQAFESIPVVHPAKIESAAGLLQTIVEKCIKEQFDFVAISDTVVRPGDHHSSVSAGVDAKIKKALKYIDGHFYNGLKLEAVADHVHLSPHYFSKLFRKQMGIGFNTYLNQQRMQAAKKMLAESDWPISRIAKNLGYSQASYFCRVFKEQFQITPQEYRKTLESER